MFDWAKFRTAKGGIKIHTCWDDAMMIPDMVNITEAKVHDSKGPAQQVFAKGTVIVEDRAYFDFSLMLQREDQLGVRDRRGTRTSRGRGRGHTQGRDHRACRQEGRRYRHGQGKAAPCARI